MKDDFAVIFNSDKSRIEGNVGARDIWLLAI